MTFAERARAILVRGEWELKSHQGKGHGRGPKKDSYPNASRVPFGPWRKLGPIL
jgi:hypothetical protein